MAALKTAGRDEENGNGERSGSYPLRTVWTHVRFGDLCRIGHDVAAHHDVKLSECSEPGVMCQLEPGCRTNPNESPESKMRVELRSASPEATIRQERWDTVGEVRENIW